jgi:hypothetical protein
MGGFGFWLGRQDRRSRWPDGAALAGVGATGAAGAAGGGVAGARAGVAAAGPPEGTTRRKPRPLGRGRAVVVGVRGASGCACGGSQGFAACSRAARVLFLQGGTISGSSVPPSSSARPWR